MQKVFCKDLDVHDIEEVQNWMNSLIGKEFNGARVRRINDFSTAVYEYAEGMEKIIVIAVCDMEPPKYGVLWQKRESKEK